MCNTQIFFLCPDISWWKQQRFCKLKMFWLWWGKNTLNRKSLEAVQHSDKQESETKWIYFGTANCTTQPSDVLYLQCWSLTNGSQQTACNLLLTRMPAVCNWLAIFHNKKNHGADLLFSSALKSPSSVLLYRDGWKCTMTFLPLPVIETDENKS